MCFLCHFSSFGFALIPVFFSHTFIREACQSVLRGKILGLSKRNIPQPRRKRQKKIAIINEVIDIALTTSLPPMIVVDFSFA